MIVAVALELSIFIRGIFMFLHPNSSSVTPNAQESEDSGLSLGYSSTEAAKRMSSSSSSINSEHEKDIYDDDEKDLRQKFPEPSNTTPSGVFDFR